MPMVDVETWLQLMWRRCHEAVQNLSRLGQSSCDPLNGRACSASSGYAPDPRSPAVSVHPSTSTSEATMQSLRHACVRAALAAVFASGGWYGGAAAQDPRSALDPITSAVMQPPITTSSGVARHHFLRGHRELDLARFIDANAHFKEAAAADPHLRLRALDVARPADSPAAFQRHLALAPRMFVAHTTLGLSYVFGEPRDFTKALEHMQAAEKLAPEEPGAHTSLGDVYRAQRNLDKAREEYTRGHQLNPRDAVLLVKRGHANALLGNYAAARADYDSAIAVGRANEKAAYVPFRAYVSVYAGEPAAAIDELNRLVASVDGMGVPDPKAAKVAALGNVAVIAIHTRNQPAAEQALKQLGPVLMQQADEAANPAFRRGQDATMAYFDGWWAARRGDYGVAQQQADRIAQLLAPDKNPRKLEPMHQLEGFIALYQGKYGEAAVHLRQGNPFDPYIKYQLAVATEGAGDVAQAKQLYREVAEYNFNAVGFALVRKDAQQKVGASTP